MDSFVNDTNSPQNRLDGPLVQFKLNLSAFQRNKKLASSFNHKPSKVDSGREVPRHHEKDELNHTKYSNAIQKNGLVGLVTPEIKNTQSAGIIDERACEDNCITGLRIDPAMLYLEQ